LSHFDEKISLSDNYYTNYDECAYDKRYKEIEEVKNVQYQKDSEHDRHDKTYTDRTFCGRKLLPTEDKELFTKIKDERGEQSDPDRYEENKEPHIPDIHLP
jgi:hypothetical protein